MVRPHTQLHAYREPVAARPAATLLLLRDAAGGFEVLMTRRSASASFAPNAYVFPGGALDASDASAAAHAQVNARPGQQHLTAVFAALREAFEELGVLLAVHADGAERSITAAELAALDRNAALLPQLQGSGLKLQATGVHLLAHWLADRDLPKRFEVPFFVARMPPMQTPLADEREQFEPVWVSPAQALAQHAADPSSFAMIFPTIRTLERLAKFASVAGVLEQCARTLDEPLWRSCPRAGLLNGHQVRYMEHEAPFGELALVNPDGQITHALDWQHAKPVQLLRHVARLTAPNPGLMTGPGTNSYIVGLPGGYAIIDPGADIASHIHTLFDAVGEHLRCIICTHSHPDHSPGARRLSDLSGAPILGLPSAATAKAHSLFTPDRALANGEVIRLGSLDTPISLRVIHTPGHAANHLCLLLEEDGLLFSGDHILNGSTTVIDPPDGNLAHYLASLDILAEQAALFILPAHGYVLAPAGAAIAQLKAHRLARHAKLLAVLARHPGADAQTLLPLVYDDVPAAVHPVALRSLLAHLDYLEH